MEIHGDGRQVRTFTFVSDTVEAIVRTLHAPAAIGEVINVGSVQPTAIIELAALVQDALAIGGGLRCTLVPYESIGGRYQDVRRRIADTRKADGLLGFQARVALSEGIAETVAWHRARRAGEDHSTAAELPAAVGEA